MRACLPVGRIEMREWPFFAHNFLIKPRMTKELRRAKGVGPSSLRLRRAKGTGGLLHFADYDSIVLRIAKSLRRAWGGWLSSSVSTKLLKSWNQPTTRARMINMSWFGLSIWRSTRALIGHSNSKTTEINAHISITHLSKTPSPLDSLDLNPNFGHLC